MVVRWCDRVILKMSSIWQHFLPRVSGQFGDSNPKRHKQPRIEWDAPLALGDLVNVRRIARDGQALAVSPSGTIPQRFLLLRRLWVCQSTTHRVSIAARTALDGTMGRIFSLVLIALLALSACTPTPTTPRLGEDGKPLPSVYKIRNSDVGKIQFRMLDSVNALRSASGAAPVQLSAELTAAAATHARDMSAQNRPWHFGSDGSSPIQRVAQAGYFGTFRGELISETFETEIETLSAWMEKPGTRSVILDPQARNMGFSWFQEKNGKIWWVLEMGG